MVRKTIKLDQVVMDDRIPIDEHFIELYKMAIEGKITCSEGFVDLDGITPFSDYVPEIPDDYRQHFLKTIAEGGRPLLHVYESGDKLIMSDDYNAYYMLKTLGYKETVVQVIGPIKHHDVSRFSQPFKIDKESLMFVDIPNSRHKK